MAGLHLSSNQALLGLFETFKFDLCVFKALETTLCWTYTVYLSSREMEFLVCTHARVCEEPILDSREYAVNGFRLCPGFLIVMKLKSFVWSVNATSRAAH